MTPGPGEVMDTRYPEDPMRSPARRARTGLRLMAVHAHPDDESSKRAATMAGTPPRGPASWCAP
jgi:hypothetical protein